MKKKYLTFDRARPVSWSFVSSFEYDHEQWWLKYVLHGKCTKEQCVADKKHDSVCVVGKTTPEMEFGKAFADSIENGTCTFAHLIKIQSKVEKEFRAAYDGIPLVGYADSFCEITNRKIEEYKTGVKPWNKKRVDAHGQLDMYCLLLWLTQKIRPEEVEIALTWIPTQRKEDGRFRVTISFVEPIKPLRFKTKRTMADILKFAGRIKKTLEEMEEYCRNHE